MDDSKKADARTSPAPRRMGRRLIKGALIAVVAGVCLVAGLPWLLGTHSGRAWVVGRVNARLAPSSIGLGKLGLSWAGPITLDRPALRDPDGKVVLAADRVTIDRGLLSLIASRDDLGTITVEGATVDVERRADGSIDLLDALKAVRGADDAPPPSAPGPASPPGSPAPAPPAPAPSRLAVAVVLKGGTLKVVAPELVEPLEASSLDGSLAIAPGRPIELAANLGGEGRSLRVKATVDPASGGRSMAVVGKSWPIHVRHSGVEAKGRFDGDLAARRAGGSWSSTGDATLSGFEAAGPALQGDRLALDRVVAACDIEQSAAGWAIRKLDLTSPVASLRGAGAFPAESGAPAQVRGQIDLAALAKMLPGAMRLRDGLTIDRGTVAIRLDASAAAGVDRFELAAGLDDFAATEGGRAVRLRQPVYVNARASRSAASTSVESVEVKAAGVDVTGSGDLKAGAKLAGTIDLATLMAQVRDVLDLGAYDLSGRARLAADYKHADGSFKGRFAVEGKALVVAGATAEPIARDLARFDGWAIGPAKADGTPAGWRQARLDLKAGDLKLDVQAEATGTGPGFGTDAALVAGFEMKVDSPVPGRFDARAKLRRAGTAYEVDELRAGITPSDPEAAPGVVALAVQGRFDSATGNGTFGPIPGYAVGAIGLGPEGAKVAGLGKAGAPTRVDAALQGDLAALDRLLGAWHGAPPKGLAGAWATRIGLARSAAGAVAFEAKGDVPALTTSGTPRGPVALAVKATYSPEADRVDLSGFELATPFGRATLAGALGEATGRRLLDVSGKVEPDWSALDPMVASSAGPSARVRASTNALHLAGQLKADSMALLLGQVFGEVGLDVTEARAFGVTVGPTVVALRFGGGLAKFNPIVTTMNGGPVAINADLKLDDAGGVWLKLGPSRIEGAAINEAVSQALLSYVAPVLAESSSVAGKVTVAVNQALLPITADGKMSLDGAVAFQDVVFQPGPLAGELASIAGRGSSALKLNEAMFVKVAEGRVYQQGLSIPVGGDGVKVAIDGSVGLDESLDLKATVPLTAKALGLDPAAGPGPTVALPIKGTLARPSIDRKGLAVALRDAARSMGEKRLKSEAGRLLDRLAGPNQGGGEPRSKAASRNPLGDLENLGRQVLDPKKP